MRDVTTEWQPRWVEYARAHGLTPEEAHDQHADNCPFVVWISEHWREWERLTGRRPPHGRGDHVAFDAWLATLPTGRARAPAVPSPERAPAEGAE